MGETTALEGARAVDLWLNRTRVVDISRREFKKQHFEAHRIRRGSPPVTVSLIL